MWRTSWWLGSCGSTTRRPSSSPFHLHQHVQTVPLESTKGAIGGWGAVDRPQEGHLLPFFVCFNLCKQSPWSQPKQQVINPLKKL
ncbi:hypothetical protein Taro_000885 [Colocasia esculenta]|uniref:Uncharacterized protein n=1 Tax=Colocasia esculenta TaxID=4460 RepID=A0A843TGH5_COLES|nr:hypothetical protein [Colocasia esculenta]